VSGRQVTACRFGVSDGGFTLVEMTTSIAVLLIVLTAAWLLLTASNDNLNRIDYGGQASELNRRALASFERDLGHAVLPLSKKSPVLSADVRTCSIMLDENNDDRPELVTWTADDDNERLLRVVTRLPEDLTSASDVSDFIGGEVAPETVLTGLAPSADLGTEPMFVYAIDATGANPYQGDAGTIGLVTFHLRNGLPDSQSNIVDRTGAYRVIAFVINGYKSAS
jgi:prepilin-type N-terminal cleavage/methylation domain-containing protein